MMPSDDPDVYEAARDSSSDPLILMSAGGEEFPIEVVIQPLGTYILYM